MKTIRNIINILKNKANNIRTEINANEKNKKKPNL